jgi:hypothetical protein
MRRERRKPTRREWADNERPARSEEGYQKRDPMQGA